MRQHHRREQIYVEHLATERKLQMRDRLMWATRRGTASSVRQRCRACSSFHRPWSAGYLQLVHNILSSEKCCDIDPGRKNQHHDDADDRHHLAKPLAEAVRNGHVHVVQVFLPSLC